MTISIVCAGSFPRTEYPRYLLKSSDKVICCDGALTTLEKRGIVPDVVIGDMDSVCRRALGRFAGTIIPDEDQDTNDLTKAFRYCMATWGEEVDSIHILGASGRGEAHTVGNLSLLMQYEKDYNLQDREIAVDLVSDYSTAFAISASGEFHVGQGRKVSLFTCDNTLKIHSQGLQWPLDEVVFDCWWKGTLNRACEDVIKLDLSHRAPLLIILD